MRTETKHSYEYSASVCLTAFIHAGVISNVQHAVCLSDWQEERTLDQFTGFYGGNFSNWLHQIQNINIQLRTTSHSDPSDSFTYVRLSNQYEIKEKLRYWNQFPFKYIRTYAGEGNFSEVLNGLICMWNELFVINDCVIFKREEKTRLSTDIWLYLTGTQEKKHSSELEFSNLKTKINLNYI